MLIATAATTMPTLLTILIVIPPSLLDSGSLGSTPADKSASAVQE